jgi:hypothetical protein
MRAGQSGGAAGGAAFLLGPGLRDALGAGAISSRPPPASNTSSSPAASVGSLSPSATRAGMPRLAAMIATCEVGPPRAVAMPTTREASRAATCEGSRSSAIRMAPSGAS